MDVVEQLRMSVDILPPSGDLTLQVGYPINDRHRIGSALKPATVKPSSAQGVAPVRRQQGEVIRR
jgi:hypothetical protein